MAVGTIIELHRGRFIVAIQGGDHAVFTLYSAANLAPGDEISGELDQQGSEMLFHTKPRLMFEGFGETGPCSLAEARAP